MQLARCVWRKRRFLFTQLTMVLAKGSRCTFFSYFVPGSVLRTRSQIVNPSIYLFDISSVFQVYKNHWSGNFASWHLPLVAWKNVSIFSFLSVFMCEGWRRCFVCVCLRAKVEGLKGVVATHPPNGHHIHKVKQGCEFGEEKSPQRDNNPPQQSGIVKWLERMFDTEQMPKQQSNHGEKAEREVNDECHWSVCVLFVSSFVCWIQFLFFYSCSGTSISSSNINRRRISSKSRTSMGSL